MITIMGTISMLLHRKMGLGDRMLLRDAFNLNTLSGIAQKYGTTYQEIAKANGISNPIQHTRGVISMARSQANDSASSQFFIVHQDAPHLDGQYAAFGRVIEGMEVVDSFLEVERTMGNDGAVSKPVEPIVIEKAEVLDA